MASSLLTVVVEPSGELICGVRSPKGRPLELSGRAADIEPRVRGDNMLCDNEALVNNAWAAAKFFQAEAEEIDEKLKSDYLKQLKSHKATVTTIVTLIDGLTDITREGWCSGCYNYTSHRQVARESASFRVYLCEYCGSPTMGCAARNCTSMATTDSGSSRIPKFCGEHRHDIPSFERASDTIPTLHGYRSLLEFDKPNLAKGSKLVAAGVLTAGVLSGAAFMAAPAIGGAIGNLMLGYSGAVATNAGLAVLGGGSVAAGGLGMAGGTAVVAAMGAALGAGLGANVTSAYVSEDSSFDIENIIPGSGGTPVVIARGFNTEKSPNWHEAVALAQKRYPTSPVFVVTWGSKELKTLAAFFVKNVGTQQAMQAAGVAAAHASKAAAKKLTPLAPAFIAASLVKNPWHTAKVRADRTGVALAGLIARTDAKEYVLIGHSLGARVMVTAAETLKTDKKAPKIEAIHLLGAAVGQNRSWRQLKDAVKTQVFNYHSANDAVLKYLYTAAMGGSVAIGRKGIGAPYENLVDCDVSDEVGGHSEYFRKVTLK
ncbi:DUF726 domain-containing protein [Gordonia sp. TBRC 11910]|uniref:DUF726 domain-containing protein n=1 Tax=Gordonia asplenii TaxID=2725283 RepID=A0A848KPT2_9ACTN|nr:DUF726 domain-containing protein [Gordonia asplenii]NMO00340.1 DUF726 domain-containing protein [Gordonia asplenii]